MSPDLPEYTDKNQHYLISGANPQYYNDNDLAGVQEKQLAPLVASNTWNIIGTTGLSYSDITESTEGTYDAYAIEADSRVIEISVPSTIISMATHPYPNGSAQNGTQQKLNCFAGKLLAITTTTHIFSTPLPVTDVAWTDLGVVLSTTTEHFMENFLEYCMISDGSKVGKMDSTVTLAGFTTGIDLGINWTVIGLKNYNDKYLAVAGVMGVPTGGNAGNFMRNYLFLWNGISSRYNYSVKIPGKFLDMKVIDGTLYVAVWVNGLSSPKTVLYYLKGTQLVPVLNPQYSPIYLPQSGGSKRIIFNFLNKVGLNMNDNSLLIYNKGYAGTETFVIKGATLQLERFSGSFNGFILATSGNSIYYYNQISTTYNSISYTSHWIPAKGLQGIDIWYDTPPQSTTDSINVILYGDGENIINGTSPTTKSGGNFVIGNTYQIVSVGTTDFTLIGATANTIGLFFKATGVGSGTGTAITTLASITPTHFLNQKRTRLDLVGFVGDKCKIVLTTINSGSWRPIIREISLIIK